MKIWYRFVFDVIHRPVTMWWLCLLTNEYDSSNDSCWNLLTFIVLIGLEILANISSISAMYLPTSTKKKPLVLSVGISILFSASNLSRISSTFHEISSILENFASSYESYPFLDISPWKSGRKCSSATVYLGAIFSLSNLKEVPRPLTSSTSSSSNACTFF